MPTVEFRLDPHKDAPLYLQLYRILRRAILNGDFDEGSTLPSENELKEKFGITRSTARQSLGMLANEGLVAKRRGKGTVVTHALLDFSIWNFGGFTDFVHANGQRPVTKVLEHEIVTKGDRNVLRLVRARGVAVEDSVNFLNLDTSWLALDAYPGIEDFDFARFSLFQVFRDHYGLNPEKAELELSIVPATPQILSVFPDRPGSVGYLCASGDMLTRDGQHVETTSVVYSPAINMKIHTSWGRRN